MLDLAVYVLPSHICTCEDIYVWRKLEIQRAARSVQICITIPQSALNQPCLSQTRRARVAAGELGAPSELLGFLLQRLAPLGQAGHAGSDNCGSELVTMGRGQNGPGIGQNGRIQRTEIRGLAITAQGGCHPGRRSSSVPSRTSRFAGTGIRAFRNFAVQPRRFANRSYCRLSGPSVSRVRLHRGEKSHSERRSLRVGCNGEHRMDRTPTTLIYSIRLTDLVIFFCLFHGN